MSLPYLPLRGVRVLDLTRILAGPFCSMILGDLGAEVIKVEHPGSGDETRMWGPPFVGDQSAYFLSVNRNKKSICVNLKHGKGKKLIQEMSKKCDVLMENFLPGKMEELGLGYECLREVAPELIYVSISGFGPTGPYRDRGGYDVVASAMAGLTHITGEPDGDPCRVGVAMTDIATGLFTHGAILGALLHREKEGRGVKIDANLLSTQVACMSHIGSNWLNAGVEAKRHGTGHPSIVPYQSFKTSDSGFLVVGAGSDKLFQKLCLLLDLSHLASDPLYHDNKSRVKNRDSLIPLLSSYFASKPMSHWLQLLEGCGMPYGPVNSIEEVFQDPQVLHNEMISEFFHPTSGRIRVPGHPVKYSNGIEHTDAVNGGSKDEQECDERIVLPSPLLGQHTNWVLENVLNLSEAEIEDLRMSNAVS